MLSAHTGRTQGPTPDALTFFKNYFVTGDYVVAGVNLRETGVGGLAHGEIHFPADPNNVVPPNADVLAAFLYWQTVVPANDAALGYTGAKFRGHLLQTDDPVPQTIAYQINPEGDAPCWSSGGGAGGAQGSRKMRAYRADVLRFLPIGTNPNAPNYGKRLVNDADLTAHGEDPHTVDLPDAGQGNVVPSTAGASLVVIYRDTRDDADPAPGVQRPPLRAIVIYNGGWTMDQNTDYMQQVIEGFYQASSAGPVAKMTHIVGDGQPNFFEQVLFDGNVIFPSPGPFAGTASPSATPAWDNWTYYNLPLPADAAQATVRVDHDAFQPFDCLSWGAILLSTTVEDPDEDGIVSAWESSDTSGQLADPTGALLPDLYAMGARPDHKDLFVEFGYLKTDAAYSNPTQGTVDPHSHLITKTALKLVGDAFKNAPVANPDQVNGINVHFDVGNNHQDGIATNPAAPYIIPFVHADGNPCSPPDASGHTFDTNCLARGGESIAETACVPGPLNDFECGFPAYRGVVGWKVGFSFLRDEGIDDLSTALVNEGNCAAAPQTCSRRFDRTRKDIFHYALFAHALGVQRLDDPNTPEDESVADGDPNTAGLQATPVPVGVSGTGDGGGSGGGDLMVTLGFWDGFVGTDFVQASTLMHELGHNFGLRHGPTYLSNNLVTIQNCQPNYESVMNYTFQIRGLTVGANGIPVTGFQLSHSVIDYSRESLPAINESLPGGLSEPAGLGTMNYLTAWYVNQNATLLSGLGLTASKRHCDGSFLSPDEYTQFLGNNGMVRVEGPSRTPPINWDMDALSNETGIQQDVTFNGATTTLVAGVNDWTHVDLRQVGSRRNVASFAIEDAIGPLSLDMGQGDNGQGDNGQGDNGQGDNGQGDNGQGDNGQGDNGQGDNGQGDNGAPPEIDFEAAADGPHLLRPVVVKEGVNLTWTPSHVGTVLNYEVWRSVGTSLSMTKAFVGSTMATTFTDTTAKKNTTYTYVVVVHNADDTKYMSNPQTISYK